MSSFDKCMSYSLPNRGAEDATKFMKLKGNDPGISSSSTMYKSDQAVSNEESMVSGID